MALGKNSHRRLNALTGEWLLVSPHRVDRPWDGARSKASGEAAGLRYSPDCYLCPGNVRKLGARNPDYHGPYVFDNDFQAIRPEHSGPADPVLECDGLVAASPVLGTCRVICFSERHDLSLPELPERSIVDIVGLWAEQVRELGARHRWVQVFENKGAVMGCSNPHPHGQIWAGDFLPNEASKEDARQRGYHASHGVPLLCRYLDWELERGERIVAENDEWVALVPWWAMWPFETLLLPRRRFARMTDLDAPARDGLAQVLKRLLTRYDNVWEISFPYSMGWHGAPTATDDPGDHWQLHAHFYPPLLRSADVKKFMVGYEMLAEAQRDITPEAAAELLRAQGEVHYRAGSAGA
jgi:UDPglucose--hexose-1-phosphate uridylyltransferase